ncbi:MAG: carbohydrate binding family 9 domain-containing protein [Prolixibacteraceae bacterium]|nr:carbohydrate binding family 9 domain-containing protein [Prolixibacteraceae bacterium]MBN2774741.1 carbohydrate binding family 9 domain-containing protein [Prolixibacteraceae bacterium]
MKTITCSVLLCILYIQAFSTNIILSSKDSTINKFYQIPKTTEKIKTDGLLKESFWKQALKIELPYEVQPGDNIPSPVKTEVFLINTENHLYIGFKAYDPEPEKIRAHFEDRDNAFQDDWVGVILDTYNDERRSFDFICNPYGIQNDAIESTNNFDESWDAIWDSNGQITDEGYEVEMSIPFQSLRFQRSGEAQTWGFDAVRSYPRNVRHHIGTFPRDRNNNCYLCQSLKLEGLKGAKPGKNIELTPTLSLVTKQIRENGTTGDFNWDYKKLEPGFTGKWGITNNIVLGTTLNPDFSQVEADAALNDVNEPFALFFPEKRPFFTEGSDFFDTQLNAIYTRSMREPEWGVKITGKEKSHTIGAYVVKDQITNLIFPGSEGSDSYTLEQKSINSVVRYKKDFGNKYTLGLLYTGREGDDYFNRVYGIDGNLRFTDKDRVSLMIAGSSTQYPEKIVSDFNQPDDKFSDAAIDFAYSHNSKHFDYFLSYENYGKDYRSDQGFVPMVGYKEYVGGADYMWISDKTDNWWSNFILGGNYTYMQNQQNELLRRGFETEFVYIGVLQSEAALTYVYERELYNGEYFNQKGWHFYYGLNPNGNIRCGLNLHLSDRIDYSNTRLGDQFGFTPFTTIKFGKRFSVYYGHTYDQLNIEKENLYKVNISNATLKYQFTKKLFLRTILQYRDYKYNVLLYEDPPEPHVKSLMSQVVLSYKLNPQTVFFLGYSDNYSNSNATKLIQTDRSFFMKIGYAFVL